MKNVLLVTSSPRGEASHSSAVALELAEEIGGSIVRRELWRTPPPTIGQEFVHATFAPADARTPEQSATLALSDELIAELRAADVVIIGAGMINFGVPASLKNWVDHVSRRGETFRYGEAGPEGLLTGKRAVLVLAYGGVYSTGPMTVFDHLEPYLRNVLGFLGIHEIEIVRIEGVAYGEEAANAARAAAETRSHEVAALVG